MEQSLRFADAISNEEIAGKFRSLCNPVVTDSRCRRIEEAVLGMERTDDLSHLFHLLAEATAPALGQRDDP